MFNDVDSSGQAISVVDFKCPMGFAVTLLLHVSNCNPVKVSVFLPAAFGLQAELQLGNSSVGFSVINGS